MDNTPLFAGAPIGVFDSGVGGLSILRELTALLPDERFVYLADNKHMPYGSRPLAEVRSFCVDIAKFFASIPVKMIVVACNTASAASLMHLRGIFPDIPFVGMEPAVKPAAAFTRTRKVGVLATSATFQGELFQSGVERFASGVEVICQPCPGLAELIEQDYRDVAKMDELLMRWIPGLLARGIDSLVLACTHYPLIKERIQHLAGQDITIFDPSPAIARRVRQVLTEMNGIAGFAPQYGNLFYATGETRTLADIASKIFGTDVAIDAVPI